MSAFLLGILIAGLIGGTIAYNCYTKREAIERSLRVNIQNLEHNISIVKKESELKLSQKEIELNRATDQNKKAMADIDMLTKDNDSLRNQLTECKRRLDECL
jgi:hypothetical protein